MDPWSAYEQVANWTCEVQIHGLGTMLLGAVSLHCAGRYSLAGTIKNPAYPSVSWVGSDPDSSFDGLRLVSVRGSVSFRQCFDGSLILCTGQS